MIDDEGDELEEEAVEDEDGDVDCCVCLTTSLLILQFDKLDAEGVDNIRALGGIGVCGNSKRSLIIIGVLRLPFGVACLN